MTHEDEPAVGGSRTLSRRTVVRAGAHAAWMVPAISLVTAAPAMAAASAGGTFTVTGGTSSWGTVTHVGGTTYNFSNLGVTGIVVKNTSVTDTATGITVTISFAGATYKPSTVLTPTASGTGWSFDTSGTATATSYVFNYSGTLAPGASAPALGATFTFTTANGTKPSGEVVSATAAASVSGHPGTTFTTASQGITATN